MAQQIERPSPLTGLAHSGIAGIAIIVIGVRELLEGNAPQLEFILVLAGIAAVVAVLAGVYGIVLWRATSFIVDDDEFRVERRLLWASSSRVDYTKIQSVDVSQPLVARLLGLAKVNIDVGSGPGVKLAFLTTARATALREHLLTRMRGRSLPIPTPAEDSPEDPPAPAAPTAPSEEEVITAVSPGTLVLGALISTNIVWFIALAASIILMPLTDGSAVGLAVASAAWIYTHLAGNWGFTLVRSDGALRIRRGLLTTVTQGLRPERIQGVVIQQDLLQRLTGLYRMRVTVLGYGNEADEEKASLNLVLPAGRWDDVLRTLAAFWPGINLQQIAQHPQPDRARWLTPLSFTQHTWGINDEVLVAHHGLISHALTIVPQARVQSLGLSQGPLQRRLKLATIEVHTTDGPVQLRLYHLDQHQARALFDAQLVRGRLARAATPTYLKPATGH